MTADVVTLLRNSGDRRSYAVSLATFHRTRSDELGPAARPVAIPDDFGANRVAERGLVVLPMRGSPRSYDLANRQDRILVYEQVLAEGTADDVRRFVDPDDLVGLWPELVLPRHVRRAWAEWLEQRRGITVPC